MPRNHRKSSAQSSSSARPVNTAPPRRNAHTVAAPAPPVAAPPAPVYVPQQEGILSRIATTAAGVAAGHVAGRMIGNIFSGGSTPNSSEVSPSSFGEDHQMVNSTTNTYTRNLAPQCQEYSRLFIQCMEQNGNQVTTCQDYMDMMKACQQQQQQA